MVIADIQSLGAEMQEFVPVNFWFVLDPLDFIQFGLRQQRD